MPSDFALKMPGVTVKNYRRVMSKFDSIRDLVNRSEEEIGAVIENKDFARKFSQFVNKKCEDIPPVLTKKKKEK